MSESTPATSSEYEPPAIDGRDPIALPLIGNDSPSPTAVRSVPP